MTRTMWSGEGTADAAPLTNAREYRTALAIVALFATIASASAFAGARFAGPLGQRWNLFAPTPPSANLEMFLVARYDDGSVSQPFDLSDAVRREQTTHRLAPPSLVRVVTKVAQALERSAYARARGTARVTPAYDLARLRRVLSAAMAGDDHVTAVRGIVLRTALRSYARRSDAELGAALGLRDPDKRPAPVSRDVLDEVHGRGRPVAVVFDSGFMPIDRTVEKLRLG